MEDKDKRFAYFVMSHTVDTDRGRQFIWPVLPDPNMGEEFCNKIKEEHKEIMDWVSKNPDKVILAEHGFYLENPRKCPKFERCGWCRQGGMSSCFGGEYSFCYVVQNEKAQNESDGPSGPAGGPGLCGS